MAEYDNWFVLSELSTLTEPLIRNGMVFDSVERKSYAKLLFSELYLPPLLTIVLQYLCVPFAAPPAPASKSQYRMRWVTESLQHVKQASFTDSVSMETLEQIDAIYSTRCKKQPMRRYIVKGILRKQFPHLQTNDMIVAIQLTLLHQQTHMNTPADVLKYLFTDQQYELLLMCFKMYYDRHFALKGTQRVNVLPEPEVVLCICKIFQWHQHPWSLLVQGKSQDQRERIDKELQYFVQACFPAVDPQRLSLQSVFWFNVQ
jgi:hypothetical protein